MYEVEGEGKGDNESVFSFSFKVFLFHHALLFSFFFFFFSMKVARYGQIMFFLNSTMDSKKKNLNSKAYHPPVTDFTLPG